MATISNTPRPGYAWDATDNCWYPIGTGPHTHSDYITQSTAINPAIVDAKGDLIVGSAADTVIRKPVGTDGQLLYADSTATGGIKWDAAPASGSMTLLSTTTLTGASVTISSISQSYKDLRIIYRAPLLATNAEVFYMRVNGDTTAKYNSTADAYYALNSPLNASSTNDGILMVPNGLSNSSSQTAIVQDIYDYTDTSTYKVIRANFHANSTTSGSFWIGTMHSIWANSSAINSITLRTSAGNFSSGTVLIYGVN